MILNQSLVTGLTTDDNDTLVTLDTIENMDNMGTTDWPPLNMRGVRQPTPTTKVNFIIMLIICIGCPGKNTPCHGRKSFNLGQPVE